MMAQKTPYRRVDAVALVAEAVQQIIKAQGEPSHEVAVPVVREALLTALAAAILTPGATGAMDRAQVDAARLVEIVAAASGAVGISRRPRAVSRAARIQ